MEDVGTDVKFNISRLRFELGENKGLKDSA